MTQYIQGKDGKFAGSIGDGKSKVPASAADLLKASQSTLEEFIADQPSVAEAWEKFQANKQAEKDAAQAERDRIRAEEEAAFQAEMAAEKAAQAADPTRLPPIMDPSPAMDAISHQDPNWVWSRQYVGAAFAEENGSLSFAASTAGTWFYDESVIRGDITRVEDTGMFKAVLNQGANLVGPGRHISEQYFETQEEANTWLREHGETVAADLHYLNSKYGDVTSDDYSRINAQTRRAILDAEANGLYREQKTQEIKYITDYSHFTLQGSNREVTVSNWRNPVRGVFHPVTVKDTVPGTNKTRMYRLNFTKMQDARLFAQEMLLAAYSRNS